MWQAIANRCDRVASATLRASLGAVLAAVASQYFTSRSSELYSEILSWALLPILIRCMRWPHLIAHNTNLPFEDTAKLGGTNPWIVALGLAVATFCAAEKETVGFIPMLTPALLLLQAKPQLEAKTLKTKLLGSFNSTTWNSAAIAVFGTYTLSTWSISSASISTVEFFALCFAYATLQSKIAPPSNGSLLSNMEIYMHQLAPRIVSTLLPALLTQVLFLGFVPFGVAAMLLASIAKTCTTLCFVAMARHTSWVNVAVVRMFSIFATRNPYIQPSEFQEFCHLIGSVLTLGQLITLIPNNVTNKKLLWTLLLLPILPYLAHTIAICRAHSRVVTLANVHKHPIESIISMANAHFDTMLKNQSNSTTAARQEYRRRYKIEPPPGFDVWYEYAAEHKSKIIDDFDVMYLSIAPFWTLSGQQVRKAMKETEQSSESDVWNCTFSSKSAHTGCVHHWRTFDRHIGELFKEYLPGDLKSVLPDVYFLVNHLDEPRVLPPTHKSSATGSVETDLSQQPTWAKLSRYCNNQHSAAQGKKIYTYGLPFVQNKSNSIDICRHREYEKMHGLFMSPTSMRLIEGMVPVLSTGAVSTMGDILFPSPAYIEREFVYSSENDVEWAAKKNQVYWTGSTSGGFAKDSQWSNFHRQRFVSLAQNLERKQHTYLTDSDGVIRCVHSSFLNSRLYDVAFTNVYQGTKKSRREQTSFYRMRPWADENEAFHSRLVFDLDGNGISGRWYKLLASRSTPLKQTLLREWHDDRLVPWVHYIPVSQSMDELPELVAYLTSTTRGQQYARRIAQQGGEWFQQAFRKEDIGIYLYRLLLELARLQDPDRPASTI